MTKPEKLLISLYILSLILWLGTTCAMLYLISLNRVESTEIRFRIDENKEKKNK